MHCHGFLRVYYWLLCWCNVTCGWDILRGALVCHLYMFIVVCASTVGAEAGSTLYVPLVICIIVKYAKHHLLVSLLVYLVSTYIVAQHSVLAGHTWHVHSVHNKCRSRIDHTYFQDHHLPASQEECPQCTSGFSWWNCQHPVTCTANEAAVTEAAAC